MLDPEPTMADVSPTFSIHRPVEAEHIDLMGHANNTVFIKWMEECAVAHSDSAGWNEEMYLKLGAGWVVRRHEVVYTRPALPSSSNVSNDESKGKTQPGSVGMTRRGNSV